MKNKSTINEKSVIDLVNEMFKLSSISLNKSNISDSSTNKFSYDIDQNGEKIATITAKIDNDLLIFNRLAKYLNSNTHLINYGRASSTKNTLKLLSDISDDSSNKLKKILTNNLNSQKTSILSVESLKKMSINNIDSLKVYDEVLLENNRENIEFIAQSLSYIVCTANEYGIDYNKLFKAKATPTSTKNEMQ